MQIWSDFNVPYSEIMGSSPSPTPVPATPGISPRRAPIGFPKCNWNQDQQCLSARLSEGIGYLRYQINTSTCWVNGQTCARLSCSWGAAIYLCNNKNTNQGVSCGTAGYYAWLIQEECAVNALSGIAGTLQDTVGWAITVGKGAC